MRSIQFSNSRLLFSWQIYLLTTTMVPQIVDSQIADQAMDSVTNRYETDERNDSLKLFNEQTRRLYSRYPKIGYMLAEEKRLFVHELLKMLYEQYSKAKTKPEEISPTRKAVNKSQVTPSASIKQLLSAIGANGDIGRLVDWIQNSFNLASVGELTTQLVVSKLGAVNCGALLKPDKEETLIPRFLLFNERFVDVPFELTINPNLSVCQEYGGFDPKRKTVLLLHGFLTGYTLLDGLTNIKNRLLDINKSVSKRAKIVFGDESSSLDSNENREHYDSSIKQQQYNVIIVDWFNGANPVPRSRYIRAAVNAQVVGEHIARFLTALITNCRATASQIQIIAHSLGCHVAGFTGKAMVKGGHKLGKITHLDPIGLCFGRLFSQPNLRLSSNDALETQAVHVSLNLFDNPLDGAQSNFMVNGGRDQIGCGSQSELRNSTGSSISLLFDSEAKFTPCSHVRALSLYEEDLSSEPHQCQIIGYKCPTYDHFLAGKCGKCDDQNSQCRLMSLPPVALEPKMRVKENLKQLDDITDDILAVDEDSTDDPQRAYNVNDIRARSLYSLMPIQKRLTQTIRKLKANTRSTLSKGFVNLRVGGAETNYIVNSLAESRPGFDLSTIYNTNANKQSTDPNGLKKDKQASLNDKILELSTQSPPLVGSQALPEGSTNGFIYYVGTGSMSPYCVNYYQVRIFIPESRVNKFIQDGSSSSSSFGSIIADNQLTDNENQRDAALNKEKLHLTLKLTDNNGHFFKGFTLIEDARSLIKDNKDSLIISKGNDNMVELTMLLNTTTPEPRRLSESVISYYFHEIVLADLIEINYMSNISPG